MKKITSILVFVLVAMLTVTTLVSCGGNTSDGYTFKVGSTTLSIGANADVVSKLGNPLSSPHVTAACGGIPGEDIVYTFAGYRVKTTPGKNGNVICMIELTDDSVKTPEGLTIGSTKEAVTSAMGTGETVGENLVYKKGNMILQFLIRNGYVTNIQYKVA